MSAGYPHSNQVENVFEINIDNVVSYLLDKKLIYVSTIVKGDLKIVDVSSRNRDLKVMRKNNLSYLLKQPDLLDLSSKETFRKECLLYSQVFSNRKLEKIRTLVPQIVLYDYANNILALQLLTDGLPLSEIMYNHNEYKCNENLFYSIGESMSCYHNAFHDYILKNGIPHFLPRQLPLVFQLVYPTPHFLAYCSPADIQLLKIIQHQKEYFKFLDEIESMWTQETIIHGDIRFDHVIASQIKKDSGLDTIRFVDWEMADVGDPAWDIAGILHDLIILWVLSMRSAGKASPEDLVSSTESLLQNIQLSVRSFMVGYNKYQQLPTLSNEALLLRCIKYLALRLLQRVHESLQFERELSITSTCVLQLSLNILREPQQAAVYLLGIPFVGL